MTADAMEAALAANLVQDVQLRRARRSALIDRLLFMLVIIGLLWVGLTNAETLDQVKSQTSPEALQRQRAAVDEIVLTINCNNRAAIQDVLDRLENEGVLDPGQASLVGTTCPPEPED